ncbi:MAG: alanine racemase [Nocardioidaceae bacterium]|nr:alanine racemase [Nocardioidaceae bacterium]MDX6307784.1 alanine racemase [Nocardioidaceae bacterium]
MTTPADDPPAGVRAEAVVDLSAISANTAGLRDHVGGRDLMAVVKADGYGHGIVESGRAAREGGAGWLGVALLDEALQLRAAGDSGPILSWLAVPGERYAAALAADVDVSAYSVAQLDEICAAARAAGTRARVQLKLDSGLGRGGAHPDTWAWLVDSAKAAQDAGLVEITGVWSHLACSDEPDHPSVKAQILEYEAGVECVVAADLQPQHLHLANSGAVLALPDTWFTMVRPGIALYGVSPFADGSSPVPLRPAMRLEADLALVKRVRAGQGVSYGHTYTTTSPTTLALVPLGYGDGIPRHASNRGPVLVNGETFTISGRVCMDQFVVDIGDHVARAGDRVVLFGDPDQGAPSARDWAVAADTIGYEVVTRIGARVPRRYLGGHS